MRKRTPLECHIDLNMNRKMSKLFFSNKENSNSLKNVFISPQLGSLRQTVDLEVEAFEVAASDREVSRNPRRNPS